jgi:hypothetical protein
VDYAWPSGGGLSVVVAVGTPSATDVRVTLTRVVGEDCHSVCGGQGNSDFYTACGGAFNLCAYSDEVTGLHMAVLDSNFSGGSADYGACGLAW